MELLGETFFFACHCFMFYDTNNRSSVDSSMNPEDLASQSVRLKEEQLRREEEKLREIEIKVQREINEKRQELLARESQLREIEARMQREASAHTNLNSLSENGKQEE